jgi:hypothetical protein
MGPDDTLKLPAIKTLTYSFVPFRRAHVMDALLFLISNLCRVIPRILTDFDIAAIGTLTTIEDLTFYTSVTGKLKYLHHLINLKHLAIRNPDIPELFELCEAVNCYDVSSLDNTQAILHKAARCSAYGFVRQSIEYSHRSQMKYLTDIDQLDGDEETPLGCAAKVGDAKMVDLFLELGADANHPKRCATR